MKLHRALWTCVLCELLYARVDGLVALLHMDYRVSIINNECTDCIFKLKSLIYTQYFKLYFQLSKKGRVPTYWHFPGEPPVVRGDGSGKVFYCQSVISLSLQFA